MSRDFIRGLSGLVASAALTMAVVRAETGDPVGYVSTKLVPGTKGSVAVCLVKDYQKVDPITAVGPDYIEYASDVPPTVLGAGNSAFLEVRTGAGAGMTFPVTGFSGRRVMLGLSPLGWIAPGSVAGVRPDWTIGELFTDPVTSGIEPGETPESADTLGIVDRGSQAVRAFYFKTGAGWREVGREAEGDKATVAVPFPAALLYHRRGTRELRFYNIGAVPMPYTGIRKVFVRPGRNLITGPFTSVSRLDQWLVATSLIAGDSAPYSDSLRLMYPEAGESPVTYFRKDQGWQYVGQPGDANATFVDMYQSLDFQRIGVAGYLEFMGVQASGAQAMRVAVAEEVVPIDPAASDFTTGTLAWASEAGQRYQVQIQSAAKGAWQDFGPQVVAEGTLTRSVCRPDGRGLIRILEKP